jgi:small conductance mechanosensitive channel
MDEFWQALRENAHRVADPALRVGLILAVGWLAIRYLVQPLRRLLERGRVEASVASFLANSTRSLLLVVVILGVLQQVGVETASLLTVLGAVSLAVALSLQNSLANFTAGLLVLSFRLVRVGDLVEVGDLKGRVVEVLPFHIVLVTADNQCATVPNTLLTNGPLRNHSTLPTRRVQWTLPLTRADDLTAVKEALLRRLQREPRVLREPAPQLFVQDWSEEKRLLAVQAWTATTDYQAVQQELLEELGRQVEALRRPGGEGPTQ